MESSVPISTPTSSSSHCSPSNAAAPPSSADPTSSKRPGRATRSFSGCRACREKKVKCDETRPRCKRCVRLSRECDYTQLPRKKYTRRATASTVDAADAPDVGDSVTDSPSQASSTSLLSYPLQHRDVEGGNPTSRSLATPQQDSFAHVPYQGRNPVTFSENFSLNEQLSPECAGILSFHDHLAIHFFRSVLPLDGDTKSPEYSGPSMVWMLARRSPMALHMVCAVGGQKWCELNATSAEAHVRKMQAIEHYGSALRLLFSTTQSTQDDANLDYILATLWLMIIYELKFGDGCGTGLDVHFQGVVSIIKGQLRLLQSEFGRTESWNDGESEGGDYFPIPAEPEHDRLSPVSCKIIVWMALLDGGAAMNGFGGAFNRLLGQAIPGLPDNRVRSRLECLRALQQRSSLANYETWGRSYPQPHLVDDMQNSKLTCLYAESGQLRYLLGSLAASENDSGNPDQNYRKSISTGIRVVGMRYHELIRVANNLELPKDQGRRQFVVLISFIVPFYHAVVLCFLRLINGHVPLALNQREAIKQIMSLAFKAFRDQGERIITRLAWPLFVVALESDDIVHRTWILQRYDELRHRGENYRRAREALHVVFKDQEMDERRIAYSELFRRNDVESFLI